MLSKPWLNSTLLHEPQRLNTSYIFLLCFDMVIIACVLLPVLVSVGQKWRCFINARAAVATVLFSGLCLMLSLGCSKCTKTSGCLWSSLASSCPKKKNEIKDSKEGRKWQCPGLLLIGTATLNLGRVSLDLIHITVTFRCGMQNPQRQSGCTAQ